MSERLKVAIASDHGGYLLKEVLKESLSVPVEWVDLGTESEESCNYADYGDEMGRVISEGTVTRGVLICGTGIGISIAVNRYAKVRAALCTNSTMARLTRAHNDANVLALGARIVGLEVAIDCVNAFLMTPFDGGRHEKRVACLSKGL